MSFTAYIVPSDLLLTSPPRSGWHATPTPGDPTRSLVVVQWDNPNFEIEFESLPGVLPLGAPWESLPAEAAPLLASFQPTGKSGVAISLASDTVGAALSKVHPQFAKLVR